nr:hypothetical protein [Tanacetum cinerariifolium]
ARGIYPGTLPLDRVEVLGRRQEQAKEGDFDPLIQDLIVFIAPYLILDHSSISAAGPSSTTASPTHGKSSFIDASKLSDDPDMLELEDITYFDDENDVGAEADFNNLEPFITVSPIPTTRIHKDHPVSKIIGDLSSTTQTRRIKRMKEALWSGTKLDLSHKETQEEGIDFEEVFDPLARIEAIRLFLAYASFMRFMVYQMDVKPKKDGIFISQDKYVAEILRKFGLTEVKSASTPIDTEKPLMKDPDGEDVDVHTYRSMIGSLMYITSSRLDIMFAVCACARARFQVTPKSSHLHAVKRFFRYLKGKPYLGLWYPKDSPFDLVTYSDSDYAGCKKQIVVATSSTEAKYVAVASCYAKSMSAKRTSWNEFSSAMTSAVICLSTGDLSTHTTKYASPTLTQKVFANMRRVGKGFSGVEILLFDGMLVEGDVDAHVEYVTAGDDAQGDDTAAHGKVPTVTQEPSIPSLTLTIPPSQPPQDIPSTSQVQQTPPHLPQVQPPSPQPQPQQQTADFPMSLLQEALDACAALTRRGRMIDEMDKDDVVVLMDEKEEDKKVEEAKEDEPTKVHEVVDVVTTAKLTTKVVTAASETVTTANAIIPTVKPQVPAATITIAPAKVAAAPSRKRKGVVIRDPEEESTTSSIISTETKSKDKGKGIMDVAIDHVKLKAKEDLAIKRYQAIKRKPQIEAQAQKNMMMYLKNVVGFKLDYFKGMSYDDIRPIFLAKFNLNMDFLLKTKEKMEEEENIALQTINETLAEKAAKRRKLN